MSLVRSGVGISVWHFQEMMVGIVGLAPYFTMGDRPRRDCPRVIGVADAVAHMRRCMPRFVFPWEWFRPVHPYPFEEATGASLSIDDAPGLNPPQCAAAEDHENAGLLMRMRELRCQCAIRRGQEGLAVWADGEDEANVPFTETDQQEEYIYWYCWAWSEAARSRRSRKEMRKHLTS